MCAWCMHGYSLNSSFKCNAATVANCSSVDATGCTSCHLGYYWNNGACTESDAYTYEFAPISALFGFFYAIFLL